MWFYENSSSCKPIGVVEHLKNGYSYNSKSSYQF